MISVGNVPVNERSTDEDFTEVNYKKLLVLAKKRYEFNSYCDINWGTRFVLWRHDCDYSLNRSFALAKLEASEGVRSTYFLNPHCEYYNLFEKSQCDLVREIIEMGHEIGLHFDASFYGPLDETRLIKAVGDEADLLERLFGIRPGSFSFHNPGPETLAWEADQYAGLVNCYSKRLKNEVGYCSDSNGYWRFRRLEDVLSVASDSCLQVLTHPGWWQPNAMPPRMRILRSVHGRALANIKQYDESLQRHGRINLSGNAAALNWLRTTDAEAFELYDILWSRREYRILYVELWRIFERQLEHICAVLLQRKYGLSNAQAAAVLARWSVTPIDKIFRWISGRSLKNVVGIDIQTYRGWAAVRDRVMNRRDLTSGEMLEEGCVFACGLIDMLTKWASAQSLTAPGFCEWSTRANLHSSEFEDDIGSDAAYFEKAHAPLSANSRDAFMNEIVGLSSMIHTD